MRKGETQGWGGGGGDTPQKLLETPIGRAEELAGQLFFMILLVNIYFYSMYCQLPSHTRQ